MLLISHVIVFPFFAHRAHFCGTILLFLLPLSGDGQAQQLPGRDLSSSAKTRDMGAVDVEHHHSNPTTTLILSEEQLSVNF